VIIVDDGSSIDTKKMLNPYGEKIRYFYKENGGVNTARLFGLGKAKGEYIALIDQDDLWVPEKLQKQVEFMEACSELDLVFGDFHSFDEDGFRPKTVLDSIEIFRAIPTEIVSNISSNARKFTTNFLYDYLRGPFIIQCTLMVRKKVCEKYEMFKTKTNGREFYEFALRSIHLLRVGFIDETLAYWRTHENNVTFDYKLYQKNTSIICEEALKYPWMDERCKEFLRERLFKAYFYLGWYYFFKGIHPEARKYFKAIMTHIFIYLPATSRWLLMFFFSKTLPKRGKDLRRRLQTFVKTGKSH
jgi:glycosyltransferase involved in cell wall biosynthesis